MSETDWLDEEEDYWDEDYWDDDDDLLEADEDDYPPISVTVIYGDQERTLIGDFLELNDVLDRLAEVDPSFNIFRYRVIHINTAGVLALGDIEALTNTVEDNDVITLI